MSDSGLMRWKIPPAFDEEFFAMRMATVPAFPNPFHSRGPFRVHKSSRTLVKVSRKVPVKKINDQSMEWFTSAIIEHIADNIFATPFRFLDLPAELRNIIYWLCINVDGVNKFLDTYYHKVKDCVKIKTVTFPVAKMQTPSIFLVSRQTYQESRVFLEKSSVTFAHGLFDYTSFRSFVRPGLLQNLGSIEINDTTFPIVDSNICAVVIRGYARMIHQLADILGKGHKLKSFTLILTSNKLRNHMDYCWDSSANCGYRDLFRDALNKLRVVRGVKKVTFGGHLPQRFSSSLKAYMEGRPHQFSDFPNNVRQLILQHTICWADFIPRLTKLAQPCTDLEEIFSLPDLGASPIMFLNRQICADATQILSNMPLTITFPKFPAGQVPHLLDLVPGEILRGVRHLEIVFKSLSFTSSIPLLVRILSKSELRTLQIHFSDAGRWSSITRDGFYPDLKVHRAFSGLIKLNSVGLESISISGDLPESYTRPLCNLIVPPAPDTTDPTAHFPMSVQRFDGMTVPVEAYFADIGRYRVRPNRRHYPMV